MKYAVVTGDTKGIGLGDCKSIVRKRFSRVYELRS